MCPPGLHITLGIFYRIFSLLEEECHLLDLAIVEDSIDEGGVIGLLGWGHFVEDSKKAKQICDDLERWNNLLQCQNNYNSSIHFVG